MKRFFRTPKGLLTLVFAALLAIAAPVEGLPLVAPGLAIGVGVAALIDAIILRVREGAWEFPSGAVLTGLIIVMVLSPHERWYVIACTAALAIVSKYIVRTRSANVFNPAALAVVGTFYVFDTGQSWWGALPDLPVAALAVLLAAGVFIADRVNKMPLVIAFLGTYYLLFTIAAFVAEPRHVVEIFRAPDLHAVLFFAFFILTDPPTSPVKYPDQILCAILVAVVSFVVFEWIGAAYYLLAGVLVGNVWEAWRRIQARSRRHSGPRRARRLTASLGLALLTTATIAAEDWPQFRGPTGQGHSSERGLPVTWTASTGIAWKVPVAGDGWSSPVVAAGRVWVTTAVPEGSAGRRPAMSLRVLAFDVETGRALVDVEAFRLERPRALNAKNNFASPTPIVDGDRVYVHFGADGTAALSTAGAIVWRRTLPYQSQHGGGGSPVLYRDLLIVSADGNPDEAFVAALDAQTGKERWRTRRRIPADQAYSTPLVIETGGRDLLVSTGAYRAAAYDPLTGREVWRVGYGDGFSNVPRPVFGHGLVFLATGFQQPALIAVRADGTGDVTRTHVAWQLRRGAPFTPSPLLVGDELYVVNDTGILTCADARTGTVHYQERVGGNYSASPVFADGRIYVQSEEGMTTVIAPGRTFERLAVNRLDETTLASMAVSDGSLFIRGQAHLYRIRDRQARQTGAAPAAAVVVAVGRARE